MRITVNARSGKVEAVPADQPDTWIVTYPWQHTQKLWGRPGDVQGFIQRRITEQGEQV